MQNDISNIKKPFANLPDFGLITIRLDAVTPKPFKGLRFEAV